jgi:nitrous oxidase accessory protein
MVIRAVFICIVAALAALSARGGDVLTVGGVEGRFRTIGSAVSNAHSGDQIMVAAGVYDENVVLDKTLTLTGVGQPTIRGTGRGSVLTVTADNCVISGFAVEHSGGDLQAEDAGILLRSNRNTVENNELRDILFGIYLYKAAENSVRGNKVEGRAELESGERGAGLHLWNSDGNRLENNIIVRTRDGLYIQNSPNNTIRGNRVSDVRYGLHYMSSDNNTFEENVFFDNVAGAAIMYSQNIKLRRNAFVHNRGFSSFGILLQDCRECLAENNLIANNATGIFLEATRNSIFRRNTIADNDTALQIFSSSAENIFTENNFIDNLSPLSLVGRGGSVSWQAAGVGNYWSDYDGYDLDSDSFGDVPHKIQNVFEYMVGNFPRLQIYLNSPAAQSIVMAEKSFPIVKGSNEVDRRPLTRPMASVMDLPKADGKTGGAWLLGTVSLMMLGISALSFRKGYTQ